MSKHLQSTAECLSYLLCLLFIVGGIAFFELRNAKREVHTVLSIDKVELTSGDSDGFSTEVKYLVTTDKGAYHINTSGFNASLSSVGMLQKDSTYILTTRGTSVQILGIYRKIIKVEKYEKDNTI